MFRFHLSTLLLLCVCAGSSVGLWLTGDVWYLRAIIPFNAQPSTTPDLPVFALSDDGARLSDCEAGFLRMYGADPPRLVWEQRDLPFPASKIYFADDGETLQVHLCNQMRKEVGVLYMDFSVADGSRHYFKTHVMNTEEANLPSGYRSLVYSASGQFKAERLAAEYRIYRRARDDNWQAFVKMPLFWVALGSFVALSVVFVRWHRPWYRAPKDAPAEEAML